MTQEANSLDCYFNKMKEISTMKHVSWRIRFMLQDVIDLRKNKWEYIVKKSVAVV